MYMHGKLLPSRLLLRVCREEAAELAWQHLVYLWTESSPHLSAYYESYFPDSVDPPYTLSNRSPFRQALHLKDTSEEEMNDYRETERNCRKFLHDATLFAESMACVDVNGVVRSVALFMSCLSSVIFTEPMPESIRNPMTMRNSLLSWMSFYAEIDCTTQRQWKAL